MEKFPVSLEEEEEAEEEKKSSFQLCKFSVNIKTYPICNQFYPKVYFFAN